ncbi:MAG: Glutamine--fructose-6-phosphate aminotransferase [isomerizing] [Chlamydiales bacterium]|nr:Glutamine--fructose-6-phosphate aminotransferase [isomerizing] [Chlamydiales bacterium]
MCGIFGYLGLKKARPLVLEGISKLEYRGYDSAGVASILKDQLVYAKEVGKVGCLQEAIAQKEWDSQIAIAHTRWATHGKPTKANAHPHFDTQLKCAVVHNGIIENHEAVRRLLQKRGVRFSSQTDTEVISQLIGFLYKGNFLRAVQRAIPLLQGAFAISVIHQNHPQEMVCAAKESPLAIGIGDQEMFISSDSSAFSKYTKQVIYLHSSEVAHVTRDGAKVYNASLAPIAKETEDLTYSAEEVTKGPYQHFMLKEIHEQPQSIQNALLSRFSQEFGTATLDGLNFTEKELQNIQRIVILACGTSLHAGLIAATMLQEIAHIPVEVEISSEFRYKNPIVLKNTLAIAISQSGETADTLAAMRELREKGAKILGVCNAQSSTLAREVDSCLFLRAGSEIGVAASKTYTSQLAVLALLTLRFARMRQMSQQEGKVFIEALCQLPEHIQDVLDQKEHIQSIAKAYACYENFFYLGRRFMYPTALEGALKLKEIAYVNANGYPAGEMKHGPIALINSLCPTVAFCADSVTYPKILSNLMEVKARSGRILAIAEEGSAEIADIADDLIWVPPMMDCLAPIVSTVAGQLFAYYVALERGADIDKPRNLAKSVTVE